MFIEEKRCLLKNDIKKDIVNFFIEVERESVKSGLGEIRATFSSSGKGWNIITNRFEKQLSRSRKRVNTLIENAGRKAFKNDSFSCHASDEIDRYTCTDIDIPSIESRMNTEISVELSFDRKKTIQLWMWDPKKAWEYSIKNGLAEAFFSIKSETSDVSVARDESPRIETFLKSICKEMV